MTPFEQQVAEVLQAIFYEWRENPPPQENRHFGEYAARRVAAAIQRAAEQAVHNDRRFQYGPGSHTPNEAALVALRGAP